MALIGAIYPRIEKDALNRIFFPANESFTKTRQPIIFQGLFEETYQFARKGKKTLQLFMNQLNTVISEKRVYEPVSFAISKKM